MAIHIINPVDGSIALTVERGRYYELISPKTIYILPLTMGLIIHQLLIRCDGPVMIARNPGIFISRALWVDCGPVEDGYIVTAAFNMANTRARIHNGDSISRLIAL